MWVMPILAFVLSAFAVFVCKPLQVLVGLLIVGAVGLALLAGVVAVAIHVWA